MHLVSWRPLFFLLYNAVALYASGGMADNPSMHDTVVTSDRLEMESTSDGHIFHFTGNVKVIGKDLLVTCDDLNVAAEPKSEERSDTALNGAPGVGAVELITASGNVYVEQGSRKATAGKAQIYPKGGKIVLSESPVVNNEEGRVEGFRITLFQGEQKVLIEGDPTLPSDRPRVVLPAFGDLSSGSLISKPKEALPVLEKTDNGDLPKALGSQPESILKASS